MCEVVKLMFEVNIIFFYYCRENNDLIAAVKSNPVQALIMPEFKNQRDNLLSFKYNNCDSISINSEGITIIFQLNVDL